MTTPLHIDFHRLSHILQKLKNNLTYFELFAALLILVFTVIGLAVFYVWMINDIQEALNYQAPW